MNRIHQTRFYSLVKHYKSNGLSLHVHGNNKVLPSIACRANTIERVVKFITNVAEEHALLLRGRVPGVKRIGVKLLLSSLTKHTLWKTYQDACYTVGHVAVGYSKFCDLWKKLCSFVLIMRPATDLCWTCLKNNNHIHRIASRETAREALATRYGQKGLPQNLLEKVRGFD